jgi:hypothetical protein
MTKLWNDLLKWLEDTSKVVGKEAGDLTRKGSLKVEIFELRRKLNTLFTQLGMVIFDMVIAKKEENWLRNKKVKSIIRRIKISQRQLKLKNAAYKKIGKRAKKSSR